MKARRDPKLSKAPDLPLSRGTGGRVVEASNQIANYYQEMASKMKKKSNNDIRSALLSHDTETKENPEYTQIYKM